MSTTKGRTYENYIKEHCWSIGIKATRRLLSGSNLKRPYDVLISGKIRVEAKRRLAHAAITFEGEWLKEVGKNSIIVFTAGKSMGVKLQLSVVCQYLPTCPGVGATDGNTVEVKKYKTIQTEDFTKVHCLKHNNKLYSIMPLNDYLTHVGYIKTWVNDGDTPMLLVGPKGAKPGKGFRAVVPPKGKVIAGKDVNIQSMEDVDGTTPSSV